MPVFQAGIVHSIPLFFLTADRQNKCRIDIRDIFVERQITASLLPNNQFTQSCAKRPSYQWIMFHYPSHYLMGTHGEPDLLINSLLIINN